MPFKSAVSLRIRPEVSLVAGGAIARCGRSDCWFGTERLLVWDGANASFGWSIRPSAMDRTFIRN